MDALPAAGDVLGTLSIDEVPIGSTLAAGHVDGANVAILAATKRALAAIGQLAHERGNTGASGLKCITTGMRRGLSHSNMMQAVGISAMHGYRAGTRPVAS